MKKTAVIISRGTYTHLLHAYEWVRLAVQDQRRVSVFFCDEAAARLTKDKVGEIPFADTYRGRETKVRTMLKEANRADLTAQMREMKEKGDVKFSICRETLQHFEINVEQLIGELDEVQSAEAFWKQEVREADQVLTF